MSKEYGDTDEAADFDSLVPPKNGKGEKQLALQFDDGYSPSSSASSSSGKGSPLYYLATVQAFVIVYRVEVLLGVALACSVGVATSSYRKHHRPTDAFHRARIDHDYSDVGIASSQYDLDLGFIDHWCLRGDDTSCRCEDPLEAKSKRSSNKWGAQHKENVKVAVAEVMKATNAKDFSDIEALGDGGGTEWDPSDYYGGGSYDDMWMDGIDDDWVYGLGPRFQNNNDDEDDYGYGPWTDDDVTNGATYDGVNDSFGDDGDGRKLAEYEGLDVVFLGDSLTEQRQGTMFGKGMDSYMGIKEVFEKTFTKSKGGDFNGIALGIAGDTAPNLLWRLSNGEMPVGLEPKVWWIDIGINDLSRMSCSEEVVLLGILRVVEEIQNHHPNAKIVLNSLMPVRRSEDGLLEHVGKHHEHGALKKKENNIPEEEMDEKRLHTDLWPSIVSINYELQKFASKHTGVKFFNADSVFVDEQQDGKYIRKELMADPVHPNLAGFKKLNGAIKKKLHEILKDE